MFFYICYKKLRLYTINNELEFIKYFIKIEMIYKI